MLFSYKAKNKRGKIIEGMADAVNSEAVAGLLYEKGLVVISIKQVNANYASGRNFDFFNRVKVKDLVIFFRQLSVMIKANLPIIKALNVLIKQTKNSKLRVVIASMTDEVDGGARLSDAMALFPNVFSDFYTSVVRSGETSGRLSEVIDYLAGQQEKDYELKSKIRGAMIYPAFIIVSLLVVGFIVMTFVIPQMTGILIEAEVKLPFLTRTLIAISNFLRIFWVFIMLTIIALVAISYFFIKKTNIGTRLFDRFKIQMPVFGKIAEKIYIVRITRNFNTLLQGGVPIAHALEVIKEVVGNSVYEDIIAHAIKEVDEGNSVSESFLEHKEIPIMVSQMIAIGEETGRLEEVLKKMTRFYSREIDMDVDNLSTLIEPFIMVILGIVIGFFVTAVITPMWQMSSAF